MVTLPAGLSLASTLIRVATPAVVVTASLLAVGDAEPALKLKSSTPMPSSNPVLSVSCQRSRRYWPGAQLRPVTVTGLMTVRLGAASPTSCVLLAAVVLGVVKLSAATAVLPVVARKLAVGLES